MKYELNNRRRPPLIAEDRKDDKKGTANKEVRTGRKNKDRKIRK